MLSAVPIIGKFFRPDASLIAYLANVDLTAWHPDFVVLHNTGAPTLEQRPFGFSAQQMTNLAEYYAGLGWHAGPHCFVDQNGVWIFSRLDRPGVHSPSWNSVSWGVEMLGDYDAEAFDMAQGAHVKANAIFLLAALHRRAALQTDTLRPHRDDPLTTHKDCPGKKRGHGRRPARRSPTQAELGCGPNVEVEPALRPRPKNLSLAARATYLVPA